MRFAPLLLGLLWLLWGCAPQPNSQTPAPALPRVGTTPVATAASADVPAPSAANGASYEVSIASAEADRVAARDRCESTVKAERLACTEAADSAYDLAKTAADSGKHAAP